MKEVYQNYFGFDNKPFNVTPDPDFLYYSEQHKEALAHILYGVEERKGFILLTGRVGSGKTTICRAFLRELDERVKSALILNSTMNYKELLETIADEFDLELPDKPSKKLLIDRLNEFVLSQYRAGNNVCLIIDEAQNLALEVLENLRLLSNLETDKEKLIQIILVGQPELNSLLNRERLRQLKQRVAVRSHLSNLDQSETRNYVLHRLKQANPQKPIKVNPGIFSELYGVSRGNPRTINLVCDRMLMAAYIDNSRVLNRDHLVRAAEDLLEEETSEEAVVSSSLTLRRLHKFVHGKGLKSFRSISWWVRVLAVCVVTVIVGYGILWGVGLIDSPNLTGDSPAIKIPDSLQDLFLERTAEIPIEQEEITPQPEESAQPRVDRLAAPNRFGIEPRGVVDLSVSESKLWCLARLASYRAAALEEFPSEEWKISLFEQMIEELLRVQQLTLKDREIEFFKESGFPGLLNWEDDLGERHLLLIPGEEALWDPLTGQIKVTSDKLEESWQNSGKLLLDVQLDPQKIYREGQTADAVQEIQALLNRAGDYNLPEIRSFGPLTRNSVMDFQSNHNLMVDGRVGPETLLRILQEADAGQIDWSWSKQQEFIEQFGDGDTVVTD